MENQTMEHTKKGSKKTWIIALSGAAVLVVALVVGILAATGMFRGEEGSYTFTLSQRDVAVELGEIMQLEVVPDEECKSMKPEITWLSSDPAVATVTEDGDVTAVAGGESKITAIARYRGEEYSASCMVTVKAPGFEYSDYRLRWFTQSKDRGTYLVKEETFERLVGSEVEIDEKDAMRQVPEQYVLNKEKSIWNGQVRETPGQCILEVYFDVGEIEYYVDYYYESAKKLGTYTEKETKTFTTYAFSKVQAEENPKEGFQLNLEAEDAVTELESVETGDRLSAYYDRVRCKVTVTYVTGRKPAVYTNVYGVGLVDAPKDALTDSLELYDATVGCYLNGNRSENIYEDLKKVGWNSVVQVRMENIWGWVYDPETGALLNLSENNSTSYAYLKGSGNTVYLEATYDITGSQTNMFGITLRSGDTSRQFWFADRGVYVRKDHWYDSGIIGDEQFKYNNGGSWDGGAFVWTQNNEGAWGTHVSSIVSDMIKNTAPSSHRLTWAVYEGVLYGNVDGETVLRLPLNHFDEEWTADKTYEIGFSTFDGPKAYDELKIRDVSVSFDDEARSRLKLAGEVKSAQLDHVAYDVINGNYLPATSFGFSELGSSATAGNVGVSADIRLQDMGNTTAAYGVTISDGDSSVQYFVQGNDQARRQKNLGWDETVYMNMDRVTPFDSQGNTHIDAFVKDGYFYIKYNGVQTQCVNMLSLFPEYRPGKTKVTVGLCSCDANLGLASYRNVKLLSEAEIAASKTQQWGFYADEPIPGNYDFEEGTLEGAQNQWTVAYMPGSSKIWQVEGVMERTDGSKAQRMARLLSLITKGAGAESDDTASQIPLRMGIGIVSDGRELRLMGDGNGLLAHDGATWLNEFEPATWKKYVSNSRADAFFNGTDTDRLPFRAVIYKDVFYMWFDDVLCWRVPLTENQFGTDADPKSVSFPADSGYQLKLCFNESGHNGRMSGLKVTMDYQVTEQTAFMKDKDGNVYSFLEAMEILEEAANPSENTNMTKNPATGDYIASAGIWDAYLYGQPAVGNLGVSADISWQEPEKHDSATGVYIKAGDLTHSFMNWSEGDNYHANYRHILRSESQNTNLAETNILGQVSANVLPVKEDGTSHVDAFVKDGYFYISYNGTQALCISMVSLFADYDPAATEVTIGIGGNQMNLGPAKFANVAFHTAQEVAALPSSQWNTYSEYEVVPDRAADVYSLSEGSFERKGNEGQSWVWTGMPLYGNQKTWQVEGIMTRTDARDVAELPMGIGISSGGKELRIVGAGAGIKVHANGAWYNEWNYLDLNSYVLNTRAKSFFANPRTVDEVAFKAVVYKDVLYVWFDGELCWRIPLTENEFENGTFPAGSDYQLTLWMADTTGCGRMSGLKTSMGYQVTSQSGFTAKMESLEAKAQEYLAASRSQMMLEAEQGGYATDTTLNGVATFYGKPVTGNQGVSVDISLDAEAHMGSGVVIKSGNKVHQFQAWRDNSTTRNWWQARIEGENLLMLWDSDKGTVIDLRNLLPQGVAPYDDNDCSHVDAFVKDGYFYLCYNGEQALCMNMVTLFADYDPASSEVSIGITGTKGAADAGQARFSNVAFLSGTETAAKAQELGAVQRNFYVESLREDCSYDLENGSVTVTDQASGAWKSVILPGTSKNWQVEGTMEITGRQWIGLGVKAGPNSLGLVGYNDKIIPVKNGGLDFGNQVGAYVLNGKAAGFFADNQQSDNRQISFRAVVAEDVMSVWFDDELCWRVPLYENQFAFNLGKGNDYEFVLTLGDWGLVKISNLKVKMGYQVTGQENFFTDSEGTSYSFAEAMNLFKTRLPIENSGMIPEDLFKGTYLTSNAGAVWAYGEKAVGNCGMSADVAWQLNENQSLNANAGTFVSVKIGNEERVFMGFSEGTKMNNGLFYLTDHKYDNLWTNKFYPNFWGTGAQMGELSVYNDDGTAHIEAYVKDGTLYIEYNGQKLVEKSMAELFPAGSGDYSTASEISFGIGTIQTNTDNPSLARFTNVVFQSQQRAAATAARGTEDYRLLAVSAVKGINQAGFSESLGYAWNERGKKRL